MPTTDQHVFTSGRPDVVVPDRTLPDLLLAGVAEHPDRPALVDGPSGRTLSYRELADATTAVAANLAARGLVSGDTFAILAPNCPEWLVGCYGAMRAGAVVTGINPLYTVREVAGQLAQTAATFVLTVPAFLDTARAAVAESGTGAEIILLGAEEPGTVPFAELLAPRDAGLLASLDPAVDLAMLPCSSGTTGLPKSVMLTHRACVANVLQQHEMIPFNGSDRVLAVAPFFHATGFCVVANGTLLAGGTVVTMPRFEIEAFLGLIQQHRITAMVLVPPLVLALAKHPSVERYDLSSLRWLACGAAPLGAQLQQACAERLGCPVLQGYGMTELTAGITLWPLGTPVRNGSAGKLVPGMQARVVDIATGVDLGPGETGELWLRGPSRMAGYLDDPAATAATIDADGWVHSGDIARIEPDGSLFVTDRIKELIKVKAFQVAPAELEAELRTHPDIVDAAVVAMPDERAGERPKAFVVRRGPLSAEEVMDYLAQRVAPHKRLGAVEFIDVIPTSPAGKTLRRLLRAEPAPAR